MTAPTRSPSGGTPTEERLPVQPHTFDADRATVAANVTRLIESHRLSFGEAARITGISKTGLYKIADGTSDPCLSSLCKLAGAFGVSLADLFAECHA